ncbi:MAG: TIR domain-containing protein, partial [Candidatus Aminicenantes bacterium]|nr:TIR domain-containing protein [Candidatus Aminicenantes bacterium]NIM77735.1 TIR domain-containing protein [Candidatus Aminicenantes bacterium]NIN17048.1 TIR domain-containing protein [Candidatus Aminicenantes bacterium]NIN40941.1 TIR domain-containing protein [Candidatus Aminicenantes bacterium]NIN83746.1 TIR domain-containing protein [Candidatus Aminicenantes bacterium]
MLFKRDIFISYAHIDNMALKEGEKGWVANFHRALEVRLAQLLGEKPEIWRDQKLQGNDYFGDEIVEQFPKTAVMISILSPRYIKSEWCTKEVREFYEAASKGMGIRINNKSRIFKVIKTHVPYDAHPPEIADTLGYEFYVSDHDTGKTKELNQKSGGELEQVYWAKLDDIAHDICDLLEKLKQSGETGAIFRQEQDHLTVYLAETSIELKKQRDMIKRELLEFGYRVLPDQRLSPVESEFKPTVEQMLAQCVLSIHMVGRSYGPVPEGSPKSIVPLQNELAAQTSKSGKLQRLIWLLPDNYKDIEDKRQEQFVHHLRTDPATQYGADFFETAIEDFKFAIHDKLKSLKPSPTFVSAADTAALEAPMTVYLAETNYELKDERESIKRLLIEQGCKVIPQQPLPLVYPELKEDVDDLLGQSDLSIHLLGEDYGVVPDKTAKSIICVQEEQAAEKSRKGKLQRLVWVSPRINQEDKRQQAFINGVKVNAHLFPNDDIFETSVDRVTATIMEKVKIIQEKRRKKAEEAKPAAPEP